MESKLTKAIKAYLASAAGSGHPPCERYEKDVFDDYWDELLPPELANALGDHCLECPACLEALVKAKQLHDDSSALADRMDNQRFVNAARKKLEDMTDVQSLNLKFAAAPPDAVMMGQALGVAIDIETGIGTTIECIACVGQKEKARGKFEIWGRQVEGTEDGYRIEKPLDYLEEKLTKGVFRNCSELRSYNLDRRRISVDLRERIISHGGSLSLAIAMSIVNAIHQRTENPPCLYSADIRQDGRLLKVGHIEAKIETALKSDIHEVVLARDNQPDVPLDHLNNPNLKILFFDTLGEVLTHFNLAPTPEVSQATCTSSDPIDAMKDTAAGIHQDVHSRGVANSMACIIDNDYAPLYDRLGIESAQRPFWNKLITFFEDLSQTGDFRDDLSTAFLIGYLKNIDTAFPEILLTFPESTKLFDILERIEDLALLVDGQHIAFVVDHDGFIDSIRLLRFERPFESSVGQLITNRGRFFSGTSSKADSCLFYISPNQNQIQVYSKGKYICRYCNGTWCMIDTHAMMKLLEWICRQEKIYLPALVNAAMASILLAENGQGGIFAFTTDDSKHSNMWSSHLSTDFGLRMPHEGIEMPDPEVLASFARLKGAVLIDYQGRLISCHTFFDIVQSRPCKYISSDRHAVAKQFSLSASATVLVASRYGTVSIYHQGRKLSFI
jgi:hypothetical protein